MCIRDRSIENTVVDNLYVIPSNVNLAGAEMELLGINDKEYILKSAVDYIKEDYDFIIIDLSLIHILEFLRNFICKMIQ